jgi:hypothetical protein
MLVTYTFVVNDKLLKSRVQSINLIKTKQQLVMRVKLIDVVYIYIYIYIYIVPDPFNK